jgi:hypothetical protein
MQGPSSTGILLSEELHHVRQAITTKLIKKLTIKIKN